MAKNNTFAILVNLSDADAGAIGAASDPSQALEINLGRAATGLLRDYARKGVMIPPEYADRIETAIGNTEPASITEHVEASVKRRGEATVVEWIIDPTQILFFQELANSRGFSLENQLKSAMDYAYMQGWFNQNTPDPYKILLTQEQYRQLQNMFDQDIVTGYDVMQRLEQTAVAEFDPLMDSLK